MLAVFLQGFALSAAMILPLGPQNAFVMNQGIKRQHHLMSASLCALSDIILICAGIFGGRALLTEPLSLAAGTGHLGRRGIFVMVWLGGADGRMAWR
nr:LysE family transporter [Yersinia enterocolitica]